MFEMLEVVKDSYFSKKLLFIVLGDDDAKYYKNIPQEGISADVYSALGQAKYSKYWSSIDKKLENKIEEINLANKKYNLFSHIGLKKSFESEFL